MSTRQKEIIISSALIIIFAGLLYYNVFYFETAEKRRMERLERHQALEAQQLEKAAARQVIREIIEERILTRNQDIKDIVEFDEKFSVIKEEYISKINKISGKLEKKVENIDDISSLVQQRIDAAAVFKEDILKIEKIPEPIEEMYKLLLEFLDNDIYTWQEIKLYYEGAYGGDDSEIRELHRKNSELYSRIEDIQQELYSMYDLEDIL